MAESRRLRMTWLIAAVAAGSLLILLLAPTALAASGIGKRAFKHCGRQHQTAPNWYRVRAYNVGCHEARHVARHYWRSGGDSHFEGWTCRSHQVGDEVWKARCTRQRQGGLQIVRLHYGA